MTSEPASPLQRTARLVLAFASVVLAIAPVVGGSLAEWSFTVLVLVFPVALIALSTGPRDRMPGTASFLLVLGALLLVSGVGIRLLASWAGAPWIWGLPAATVLMGAGLGVVPLVLVGWRFAAAYEDWTADVERLREEHEKARPRGGAAG